MAEQKKQSRRWPLILGFLVLVFAIASAWFLVHPGLSRRRPRQIILISIDTCRADHLSCYGCPRITTPNIDAVASEAFLFQNAISHVPLTLPSHSSMLTGAIPPFHGVHDNAHYELGQSAESLAEILRHNGFVTGAVIGSFILDSQFGLAQGFDTYNDRFDEELKSTGIVERRGEEVSRYALKWLEQHQNEPFFLFLHYFDPHANYIPPEPFATIFGQRSYAGEVAYTDYCIGYVINRLKELGLYDSSLIIITSDHGEMLREHGEETHGYFIYQSAIKVPLIFKLPGQTRPRKIDNLVGLIDIAPTVCALVGLEPLVQAQGRDLSPYFRRPLPLGRDRQMYCESLYPTKYDANPLVGIVTSRFKYIHTKRPELYDLSIDPDEQNNLITQRPGLARSLQNDLNQIFQKYLRKSDSDSGLLLGGQARRRLESLGYISGRVTEGFEIDDSKEDPKDLIDLHSADVKAVDLLYEKKYSEARDVCEQMLQQHPGYYRAHFMLANVALGEEDFAEAVVQLSEALSIQPTSGEAHNNMGIALQSLGKIEEATQHFYQAVRFNSDDAQAHNNLATALQSQGRLEEALREYQQALKIDENSALVHYNIALALQSQGKLDEAISHYRRAVQLNADYVDAHHNLGNALALQGSLEQAVVHWAETLWLKPDQIDVLEKISKVLYEMGKTDEVVAYWSKVLQLNADQPELQRNLRYRMARHLAQYGRLEEAIRQWDELLLSEPNDPALYNNLAIALYQRGRLTEAIDHWKKLLELRPDDYQIFHNLGWLLATHPDAGIRNPAEAVRLARRACELTGFEKPHQLDALAAAYAAAGQFDKAVETAEKALQLVLSSQQQEQSVSLRRRLELYKTGKPYVETSPTPSKADEK